MLSPEIRSVRNRPRPIADTLRLIRGTSSPDEFPGQRTQFTRLRTEHPHPTPDSGHASPDSGMELARFGIIRQHPSVELQTSSDNSGYDSNAFLNGFSDSVASFRSTSSSVYYKYGLSASPLLPILTEQFHNNTETEFTVGFSFRSVRRTTIMHEKLTWWVRMTTTPSLRLTPMKCGIWSPASPWSSRTVPRWDWVPRSQITMWN